MKRNLALAIACISLIFTSCRRNNDLNNLIPFVQVNQTVFLSDPANFNVQFTGGWVYLLGGSRGIILHRLDQDRFVAFDRHCTYDINNPCGIVDVEQSFLTLNDPCCGSKFLITDGSIFNGPAEFPLQQYRTQFNQTDNTVAIFN